MELSAEIMHSTVASIGPEHGERRKHARVPMRFKVKVIPYDDGTLGETFYVWTRDISPGGIGIIHRKRMREGRHFIIRLPREDETPVLLLCTVRACKEVATGVFNIGANFEEVAESETSDCRILAMTHFQPEMAMKFIPASELPKNLTNEIRRISDAILS